MPATGDAIDIDFVTGATGTTPAPSGWDFNPYDVGTLLFYWGGSGSANAGVAATASGPYLDLAVGSVISSASTFRPAANGVGNETAAFLTTGTHVLGFKFLNEATGATDNSYLCISTTAGSGFPATILGHSHDNTGAAITVASPTAAVPEPGTGALFSLGALAPGASALRRSRRRNAA